MTTIKLAIGSGGATDWYRRNDFITLDADRSSGADIIMALPPLPDLGLLEYVEAIHFWEHLYLWQAEELAAQICAALKPDGKFVLELPNLILCCRFMLGIDNLPVKDSAPFHPDPRFTMWGIFGAQNDPVCRGNVWQAHKWGYTPQSISEQLIEAGFRCVKVKAPTQGQPERDMRVEAVK